MELRGGENMIRKQSISFTAILTIIFLLSGCGLIAPNSSSNHNDNNNNPEQVSNEQQNNSQNQVQPIQPDQVYPEIPFDAVSWTPSDFKPRSTGGIFLYTKEKHAGSIDDDFSSDWDEKDILYIQLSTQYQGYKLEPLAIQKRGDKLARIVLKLTARDTFGSTDKPAFTFIKVPRGALAGYSFEVVDESENPLKVK